VNSVRRLVTALSALVFTACALPATALAGAPGSWSTSADITTEAVVAALSVGPQGDPALFWWRRTTPDSPAYMPPNFVLRSAGRPLGTATWSTPVDITTNPIVPAGNPVVARNARGDTLLAWLRGDGECRTGNDCRYTVVATMRPSGATQWEAPLDIGVVGSEIDTPLAALDAQGNATLLWTSAGGPGGAVESAVRTAGSGSWQAPVHVVASGGRAPSSPSLVVADDGTALAIWSAGSRDESVIRVAARAQATGAWQTPVDLSPAGTKAYYPSVALDRHGKALAMWVVGSVVRSTSGRAGSSHWSKPVSVPSNAIEKGEQRYVPIARFDSKGNAIAMWSVNTEFNDGASYLQSAARRATDGSWRRLANPSGRQHGVAGARLVIDSRDNAIVTWATGSSRYTTPTTIESAELPATSGIWQEPIVVASSTTDSPLNGWTGLGAGNAGPVVGTWGVALPATSPSFGPSQLTRTATYRPADAPPPVLSRASMTRARFRVGTTPTATRFRVELTAEAGVRVSISRRRAGGHTVLVGAVSRNAMPAGAGTVAFTGRLHGRRLAPGAYAARMTAANRGGTSKTTTLRFTVVS